MRYLILFCLLGLFTSQNLQAQCDDCYETPFLGVYSNGISKNKARKLNFENSEGSYVTGIIGNTAAEKAGLQPHYYRNGKKQQKKARLGKRSDAEYNKRSKREDPFLGVEQSNRNWDESVFGVRINVVDNSTAKSIGLEDGDLITHINGFPILDWTDMGTAIDMMEVGNQMEVTYERKRETRKSSGTIKSLADTKYKASYSYADSDNRNTKSGQNSYSYQYDYAGWFIECYD